VQQIVPDIPSYLITNVPNSLIGRKERGFDSLGYHFKPEELSVAKKTIERFMERISRLYEQGADSYRIGQYVARWAGWGLAGFWQRSNKKRAEQFIMFCPFRYLVW